MFEHLGISLVEAAQKTARELQIEVLNASMEFWRVGTPQEWEIPEGEFSMLSLSMLEWGFAHTENSINSAISALNDINDFRERDKDWSLVEQWEIANAHGEA